MQAGTCLLWLRALRINHPPVILRRVKLAPAPQRREKENQGTGQGGEGVISVVLMVVVLMRLGCL